MDKFYDLAKKVREERLREEHFKENSFDTKVELEFRRFSFWCRINDLEINGRNLSDFAKLNNLNFWVIKSIAERFLNYKYKFNHDKNKWELED